MHREILPYNRKLKERARALRENATDAERRLWHRLKGKQMLGFDFDRQRMIDNFIVDFYCKDLLLAIEVDGLSHVGKESYDRQRQAKLEGMGVTFLRFTNDEVAFHMPDVLTTIRNTILATQKSPLRGGEPGGGGVDL